MQPVNPLPQAYECGQEASCSARVPNKDFQRLRLSSRVWDSSPLPCYGNCSITELKRVRLHFDLKPKLSERLHHHLRILAPERASQCRLTISQCRKDQRAIRNAF